MLKRVNGDKGSILLNPAKPFPAYQAGTGSKV